MKWFKAEGCETLAEGKGCQVDVDGALLGIFKLSSQYFAIQDFCPHRGGSLGDGDLDDEGWVACPLHAWFFNVRTGASSMSETMKIKTFECKYEEGSVYVSLPPANERKLP
jgi:nitrite reductase/ring-hydroxylating ferredoxin subunit